MDALKKRLIICILLTIPIIILWVMESPIENQSILFLLSIIYFYGGHPFFKGTIRELRDKTIELMSLVTITVTIAYIYSVMTLIEGEMTIIPIELAIIINIILFGRWLEKSLTKNITEPIRKLIKSIPSEANLIKNGKIKKIPTETIKPGDLILVKKGETIPADGIIIKGSTTIQPLTRKPIKKDIGETVTAASINIKSPIAIEVTKVGRKSFISQIIKLLTKKEKTQRQESADKIASIFIIITITVAIITFIHWKNMPIALEHALAVLIVASPHAIRLAAPITLLISAIILAKNGIIIKNKNSYENATKIDAIAFNKTGTITSGEFKVTDIISIDDEMEEGDIINYAAAIESKSQHPIAKGIREVAKDPLPVKKPNPIPGKGITGYVGDSKVQVINYMHLNDLGFQIENPEILEMMKHGKTVVFVIINDELKGCIGLSDTIKTGARKAIRILKDNGMKCIMLTGENKRVAERIAEEIGLDNYHAELTAEEKSEKIKKMQEEGLKVAMITHADDIPALKQADLSIAIVKDPNINIKNADIILTKNNPLDVLNVLELATATHNKIRENLAWAITYNTITITLSTGILYTQGININPPIGAALMILSTIIIILNSKTLQSRYIPTYRDLDK